MNKLSAVISGQNTNETQFMAYMQSIGLARTQVISVGVGIVAIIGMTIVAIALFKFKRRRRSLISRENCDKLNGSLLEMTSSVSSTERSHMHWDELYDDFIDFKLAESTDEPVEEMSIYSNTLCKYGWEQKEGQIERNNFDETCTTSKGIYCNSSIF